MKLTHVDIEWTDEQALLLLDAWAENEGTAAVRSALGHVRSTIATQAALTVERDAMQAVVQAARILMTRSRYYSDAVNDESTCIVCGSTAEQGIAPECDVGCAWRDLDEAVAKITEKDSK